MKTYKMDTSHWHIIRVVILVASILVATSITLAFLTGDQLWLLLAAFIALAQIIFSLTGYCTLAILLKKAGVPEA